MWVGSWITLQQHGTVCLEFQKPLELPQNPFSYPSHWTVCSVSSAAVRNIHFSACPTDLYGGAGQDTRINPMKQVHDMFRGPLLGYVYTNSTTCCTFGAYTHIHMYVPHTSLFLSTAYPSSWEQRDPRSHLICDWMTSMKHLVRLRDEFTVMPSCV